MRAGSNDQFEQMLAFALGWITHVGTDTIGPLVRQRAMRWTVP